MNHSLRPPVKLLLGGLLAGLFLAGWKRGWRIRTCGCHVKHGSNRTVTMVLCWPHQQAYGLSSAASRGRVSGKATETSAASRSGRTGS